MPRPKINLWNTREVFNRLKWEYHRRDQRQARGFRESKRIKAVLRAMTGKYSLDEIAVDVGYARSTVQIWLDCFRCEGLDSLLHRKSGSGKYSEIKSSEIQSSIKEAYRKGEWHSARQLAVWLEQKHHIELKPGSMYYWLRKFMPSRAKKFGTKPL